MNLAFPNLPYSGFRLIKGVVGGTNERSGFDVLETHLLAKNLVIGKFIGMDVANDGQVFACGLEILAEREDVRTLGGEFLQG